MMEEYDVWALYFETAKEGLNLKLLWIKIQECVLERLDVQLSKSWLNYLLHLATLDETSVYLIYQNFKRRTNEEGDECLELECYDYM